MANTCNTEYRVFGPKKQLDKLWKVLNELIDANKRDLSDLVKTIGGDSSTYCRGYITSIDREPDGDAITIWQDTAWCEQQDVRHLLEEKFPGIKIYFFDEEFGCEWIATNDLNKAVWEYDWCIDAFGETEYFASLKDAADYINKCYMDKFPELSPVEATEESINDTFEKIMEVDEDENCYLYHVSREDY